MEEISRHETFQSPVSKLFYLGIGGPKEGARRAQAPLVFLFEHPNTWMGLSSFRDGRNKNKGQSYCNISIFQFPNSYPKDFFRFLFGCPCYRMF